MSRRLLTVGSLVLVLLGALPAAASATFIPGPAGKIAFASGRGNSEVPSPADNDDAKAKIWVVDYPFGTPVQATTLPPNTQHRHPNWSPDHTRIVYAAGVAFNPTSTYALTEERPVWSPDGNTLYYNRGTAGNRDLYKISPVSPGAGQVPIEIGGTDDWQPALSPDGNTLCFLRGAQNETADLYRIPVDGGEAKAIAASGTGELNCVWSPDGTKILFTLGAFGAGQLVTTSPNGGAVDSLGFNVAKHFDGNADWATNFSPTCEDRKASIPVNGFVSVGLGCTDPDSGAGIQAPHPEGIDDSFLEVLTPPAHGTLGGLSEGKVIYTPNKDFRGTDTFTYTGSDSVSDADPATVTIQVGQEQGGGGADKTAPKITNVKVSAKRWLSGGKLASLARLPVGTTISFRLSEAARATVVFQRAQPGRRVGGKCAKPTAANGDRKACVRYVSAGQLSPFAGKAGSNKVKFQGRLSRAKSLAAGTYRVVVRARDAAGNAAKKNGPSFTILNN